MAVSPGTVTNHLVYAVWQVGKTLVRGYQQKTDSEQHNMSSLIEALERASTSIKKAVFMGLRCGNDECEGCSKVTPADISREMERTSDRMIRLAKYLEKRWRKYRQDIIIDLEGYREFTKIDVEIADLKKKLKKNELSEIEFYKLAYPLELKKVDVANETTDKLLEFHKTKMKNNEATTNGKGLN